MNGGRQARRHAGFYYEYGGEVETHTYGEEKEA